MLVAGLEPGDRVGILALNRVEFLEVLFGAMRAGCVPVMINVKLPDETVEFIIGDAAMKIVFADYDQAARVPAGVRTVPFDDGEDPFEAFKIPTEEPFPSFFPRRFDIAEQPYTRLHWPTEGRVAGSCRPSLDDWQDSRKPRHSRGRLFSNFRTAHHKNAPS